jgi:hypothetical protein
MPKTPTALEGADDFPEEVGKVEQPAPATGKTVRMRVSTKGDGKIHTGEFITGTHVSLFYKKGDEFNAPAESVEVLQDRGLADTL